MTDEAEFTAGVVAKLEGGHHVRTNLPAGGRLHIDRPVPFLCVYRRPPDDAGHVGLNRLVACQTSVLTTHKAEAPAVAALVAAISEVLTARFGTFLVVEFWETSRHEAAATWDENALEPGFVLSPHGGEEALAVPLDVLRDGLGGIAIHGRTGLVRQLSAPDPEPFPLRAPVDGPADHPWHWIGLGIDPVYRDPSSERVFPKVLAELELGLRDALLRTFDAFCRSQSSLQPVHFHALGRRHLAPAIGNADRHLERVSNSFDFLLMVTPSNAGEAWKEFEGGGFERAPHFHYRPLPIDPEVVKRTLYDVAIEKVEDPSIAGLLREKQLELDRQITMLLERETPNFLYGGLQIYGDVEPDLLVEAQGILHKLAPTPPRAHDTSPSGIGEDEDDTDREDVGDSGGAIVGGAALVARAEAHIAGYRRRDGSFAARVEIRDDIPTGMLVSRERLLVSRGFATSERRLVALLHHEIGTHLVTYFNGRHQRLSLLATGLAGYESFQEGLAVLAEHLSGGLTAGRLRRLAARVVACANLASGATFIENFRCLVDEYGFARPAAYNIVMRVHRGGGLMKDAIYLRGLREVIAVVREPGSHFENLFVGKIARRHRPVIDELAHRAIVQPSKLAPAYLADPVAHQRLASLRASTGGVSKLADEATG
ncbi:flavohemoglobin expression-modulating QEGLA motif protein [soil metagenome]